MKIRTYLLLVGVAISVPIVIFSAIALNMLLESERRAALRSLNEMARATALVVERELGSAEAALRVLALSPHLTAGESRSFYNHAKAADRGEDGRTILFAENGQQIINTVVPFGSELPPPPPYVTARTRKVIQTQETVVSGLIIGAVQQRPVTTINVPVPVEQGQRFVLGSVFGTSYFQKLLAARPVPASWRLALIDAESQFIAHTGGQEYIGRKAEAPLVERIAQSAHGQVRYRLGENEVYEAFTRAGSSGWTVSVAAPVSEIEESAQKAVITVALGLLVAVAVAVGAALVFGRRVVESVASATRAAGALAHGKPQELGQTGILELDQLHHALGSAGKVLAASEAERSALLKSEQEARSLAEQQNRSKDEFLAMLGHELRNPLGGISGAVELLEMEAAGEERKERARAILRRQTEHLERIVDDLLDLSRISKGKVKLDLQPVDLRKSVQATVDALRAAGRNDHLLTLELEPVWVLADRTRIDQVVNNLVTNALKYTPSGGSIHVRVYAEQGDAVLVVRDTGIGISSDLLPRLFDIFIQGAVSLDRSEGGLGIGLSLVRYLVQRHGGTITAESAGPGHGSVFTVRLPKIATPVFEEAGLKDEWHAPRCTVLLVEDNDDTRTVLAAKLSAMGVRVLEAADGREGVQRAIAEIPDVAIVDVGLPIMNGYELARHLRAEERTRDIGLIALTGYGQDTDRQNALAAGFDVHLVKPVRFDLLTETIERVVAPRRP